MFLTSFWMNILVFAIGNICSSSGGYVHAGNGGRSFSSVIKQYSYEKGHEVLLYKKYFGQQGYVTEQWFTGGPFDNNARLRVYIDGEETASIDYYLFMSEDKPLSGGNRLDPPWSTKWFGQLASDGGYFTTFRIPFMREVKITMQNNQTSGYLWYIVRGLVGLPLVVGNFELPSNSRLRVYKQNASVSPLEFHTILNTTDHSGMLFLVTVDAQSETPLFMESCMRAKIDDQGITFLSSGMEDFFLSAFYFDRGPYISYQAGLTYKLESTNSTHIVAYKFFVDDPVIFSKSIQLIWRNSETLDGPDGCPSQFPAGKSAADKVPWPGETAEAHIQSYVWVYEWPLMTKSP